MSRSLFQPLTLQRAVEKLGFVQADPIRAPARAQDLTLRHRVRGYRAGDLERRYPDLGVEEDVLVNYGFVSSAVYELMHPRAKPPARLDSPRTRAQKILAFVRERGEVHPREVDSYFAHGRVTNYWGGSSSATTHLLEELHYRGWLRVTRRERGIRLYQARERPAASDDSPPSGLPPRGLPPRGLPPRGLPPRERVDRLVDVVINIYAPLPALSLSYVVSRLRYAVPQLRRHLKTALVRAKKRLAHTRVDGTDWYWPAGEPLGPEPPNDTVRLLAPFDPVVWDRRRFELFWTWPYRFEAYTPVAKRRFGYYALPILWRDRVVGWANLSVTDGALQPVFGYAGSSAPRERSFARELDAELDRFRSFLGLGA